MPVDARVRLEALVRDLGSQAAVASLIGVSPSRVSRWLRQGEGVDPANRRKLEAIEFVLARLMDVYHPETALEWLGGFNAHLGDRRPIDLLETGRVSEVLVAVEAASTGAYA